MASPSILFSLGITLVSFSTLVFAFAFAQNSSSPVLVDSDGDPLRPHKRYLILSAGGGGGLAISVRDRRRPCPQNVMQEPGSSSVGLPLILFPAEQGGITIAPSADVNVAFSAATTCVQSTVWKVGEPDPITGRRYVETNGFVGERDSWFKIQNSGGYGTNFHYKIVYCSTATACNDVGVFVEESGRRRWVGLGGEPLFIAFNKPATSI